MFKKFAFRKNGLLHKPQLCNYVALLNTLSFQNSPFQLENMYMMHLLFNQTPGVPFTSGETEKVTNSLNFSSSLLMPPLLASCNTNDVSKICEDGYEKKGLAKVYEDEDECEVEYSWSVIYFINEIVKFLLHKLKDKLMPEILKDLRNRVISDFITEVKRSGFKGFVEKCTDDEADGFTLAFFPVKKMISLATLDGKKHHDNGIFDNKSDDYASPNDIKCTTMLSY